MAEIFWKSKTLALVFYLIIAILIDFTFGSFIAIIENLSGYDVVKNFTTKTYTECHMHCEKDLKCVEIFVDDEIDDNFKRCYLLRNKTMNGTVSKLNETKNCTKNKDKYLTPTTSTKEPTNVALNKPSIQSSQYPPGNKHPAKFGNDGIKTNLAATNMGTMQFWQVDLKKVVNIQSIKLYLDSWNMSKGRYTFINIQTSLASAIYNWKLCTQIKSPKQLTVETSCESNSEGQIVRIQLPLQVGNNVNLALREVEIYA